MTRHKYNFQPLTYYIYTLSNPYTNEVFYVGCTSNPKLRYKDHCRSNGSTKTAKYIKSMGFTPIMNIVQDVIGLTYKKSVFPPNVKKAEYKLADKYLKEGKSLTNVVHAYYTGYDS